MLEYLIMAQTQLKIPEYIKTKELWDDMVKKLINTNDFHSFIFYLQYSNLTIAEVLTVALKMEEDLIKYHKNETYKEVTNLLETKIQQMKIEITSALDIVKRRRSETLKYIK